MAVFQKFNKEQILVCAIHLAFTYGYRGVLKRHIADRLKCAMGTVNHHWGTMDALREAIVREALRIGNRAILAQAVALNDPLVKRENLSRAQRAKLDTLAA